jgi:hypothetical protein
MGLYRRKAICVEVTLFQSVTQLGDLTKSVRDLSCSGDNRIGCGDRASAYQKVLCCMGSFFALQITNVVAARKLGF